MADLGTKHECPNCGVKFYDLGRSSPTCPRCGLSPDEAAEAGEQKKAGAKKAKAESKSKAKKAAKKRAKAPAAKAKAKDDDGASGKPAEDSKK